MNTQENESILKSIEVLDKTADDIRKANTTAIYELQGKKKELAEQILDNNEYIKEYVKNFYSTTKFDDTVIEYDFLRRIMNFDFTKIPETLHENLKEYMQDTHCMYYYKDNYNEGFSLDSTDNIYISYENEIFANFSKKSYKFSDELDKFVKIELLMQEHGIYPDVIELGYYGEYYADYNMPKEYTFLKTGMKQDEKILIQVLNDIKDIYDNSCNCIGYNAIIEHFTPEFITKINNNLTVELTDITLDADFNLKLEFYIPTKLKAKDLKKLNVQYNYNKYNDTYITVNANIKEYLQEVIK